MSRLEADRLTYHYPDSDKPALHEMSLRISTGEFVAVIGANNSGKSTLCYALTGVVPHLYNGHMKGRVLVNGVDTREKTVSEIAQHIGLVLQIPENQLSGIRYTVSEEVAFGLENQGVSREAMMERVEKSLRVTGLEDHAERSPFHLSGGQQQRLALATVLAIDPSIIVLDEPTTFLDPQGSQQVFEILHHLKNKGKTIVIAEQRVDLIAEYADRILVFDKGHLIMDGKPEDVLISPVLKKIHLNWTRYTQVAELAHRNGIWPADKPLTISLSDTADTLLHNTTSHAYPG